MEIQQNVRYSFHHKLYAALDIENVELQV